MARIVDATGEDVSDEVLEAPARALRAGELVAFPTETVYGLGAHALDARAVRGIFEAKGRPANNPLIVHVHDVDAARALTTSWDARAEALAEAFWPGPLTLVLPRVAEVPDEVSAGLGTVGLRVPAHPIARRLIELAGVPVAAPSANRYTRVSPTLARHVVDGLGDALAFVVDGGATDVGVESTVLSLAMDPPTILRPGMVTLEQVRRVLPDAVHRQAREAAEEGVSVASPGLARKHYSPRARVVLAPVGRAQALAREHGERAGWVALGGSESTGGEVAALALPDDPGAYAAGLYAMLHRVDALGLELVVFEEPPDSEAWRAVRDRLWRATA